jgi:hypothetical protein
MLGDCLGRDEYIDRKHSKFRRIKSGRRSGVGLTGRSAPFSLRLKMR